MIQDIERVFELIRSKQWTKAEFEAWCVRSRTVADAAYDEGYADGLADNEDCLDIRL